MQIYRVLRACVLSALILLSSCAYTILPNTSCTAQTTAESTTLYFTPYDPISLEDEFGSTQMNLTLPTATNDSVWPPNLLSKTDKGIIPEFNTEQILTWFELWVMFKFSEFDEFFGEDEEGLPDEFSQYFKDLFDMFNPFKVREDYIYTGEETAEISGDILYKLYFSSNSRFLGEKDTVKVSIAKKTLLFDELPVSTEIKNTTATIKPTLLPGKIKLIPIELSLENQTITLEPNEILSFTVEIIPTQKILNRLLNFSEKRGYGDGDFILKIADFLSKRKIETLQQWGESLTEVVEMIDVFSEEGMNLSLSDLGEITDALQGSSFIFGSSTHPSHVLLPIRIAGDAENSKVYYLHEQNIMNENLGTNTNTGEADFSKAAVTWSAPALERSKILKQATASLYLNARNILRKTSVTATLSKDQEILATSTKEVSRDILLSKPNEPTTFSFENINKEIEYGSILTLEVSISDNSKIGRFGKIMVLYDTETYPSLVSVSFTETDNVQVDYQVDPESELIVPGGSLKYTLNITSQKNDDITVSYKTDEQETNWIITIIGDQTKTYLAGETSQVIVYVNSTDPTKEAYEEIIDINFIISGKTGLVKQKSHAEISEEAVNIDVQIVGYTSEITRKKGQDASFYVVLQNNNTAAIDDIDSYTITAQSTNNWAVDNTKLIKNLQTGKKTEPNDILVVVSIPKNTTFESDTITVTIASDTDPTKTATATLLLKISEPDFFESIANLFKPVYEFFESTAESLGLTEVFGAEYASIALVALLMVIILFIFIILALVLTKKYARIMCTNQIQEIQPDGTATYTIIIENLSHKPQTFTISTDQPMSAKWKTTIDQPQITIPAKNKAQIYISIQPTIDIQPKDWTKTEVHVARMNHKKTQKISLMTMIHEGQTCLQIANVHHWPAEFKAGDQIQTSLKLLNKGTITARDVKVILYINGRQKNKVQVTIPSKGYADITVPWIAQKGKNKVRIKAVEQ